MASKLTKAAFLSALLASTIDCPYKNTTPGITGTEPSIQIHNEIDNVNVNLSSQEIFELHRAAQNALDSDQYSVGTIPGTDIPTLVYNYGPLQDNLRADEINPQNKESFLNQIRIFKDWLCEYGRSLGPLQQLNLAVLTVGTIKTINKTAQATQNIFSWTLNKIKFIRQYFIDEKETINVDDTLNQRKIDKSIEQIDKRVMKLLIENPPRNLPDPRFNNFEETYNSDRTYLNSDIKDNSENYTHGTHSLKDSSLFNFPDYSDLRREGRQVNYGDIRNSGPLISTRNDSKDINDSKDREERERDFGGAKRTRRNQSKRNQSKRKQSRRKQNRRKGLKTYRRKATIRKHKSIRTSSRKR